MTAEQLLFLLAFTAAATVAQIAATFITDRIKSVSHAALSYRITTARELAEQADMKADGAHERISLMEKVMAPAPRGRPRKVEPATVTESAPISFETASDRDHGDEHRAAEFKQAAGRG